MLNANVSNVWTYLPIWFKPKIQIFLYVEYFIKVYFEFYAMDFDEFSLLS